MALFTDGPATSLEDLAAQDSQLLNVANAEGIDLTVKLGLAHEAIGLELEELLQRGSSYRLTNVVVTPALRLWHTYRTLEWVYRDAFHSQLNDRYAAKRDQFRELSKWAYNRLVQAGVGITLMPVPRAPSPALRLGAGGLPEGMYYAAMAWVNAAGDEGACSTASAIEVSGTGFVAGARSTPADVIGWNLYAGTAEDTMTRQNASPLGLGDEWPVSALVETEARPGRGQAATLSHGISRVLQRG